MTPSSPRLFLCLAAFALAPVCGSSGSDAAEPQGSVVVDRILRVLEAHGEFPIIDAATTLSFMRHSTLYRGKFWVPIEPLREGSPKAAPLEAIAAFKRELDKRGIELLLVLPPTPAALYPDFAAKIPWDPAKDGRIDRAFLEFANLIRSEGATVVDVFPELYARRLREDPDGSLCLIYYPHDQHWTPEGAEVAALEVANAIKSQAWYQPHLQAAASPKFEYVVREEPATRRFLPEPGSKDAPSIGRRVVGRASRIVPAAGSPSLSEMNAIDGPIHVIGDSFASVGAEFDSSFCDHLAAAAGLPVGRSVIAGGAMGPALHQFVRSAPLAKIKAVVWEISLYSLHDPPSAAWSRVALLRPPTLALFDSDRLEVVAGARPERIESAVFEGTALRAFRIELRSAEGESKEASSAPEVVLRWKGVQLGAAPLLVASQAVERPAKGAMAPPSGVEFGVSINGKAVHAVRHVLPLWAGFEVDLAPYARQTVDVKLSARLVGGTAQAVAHWGEPEVVDATFKIGPPSASSRSEP